MMKLPVASHSFLNAWSNCPRKAYRMYIAKDLPKFVPSKEMKWGDEVHKAFEVYIKHGTMFPKGMEQYEALARPLVENGAYAEKMLGITAKGEPCDFFDRDVWLRGKVDATVIREPMAAIWDWKSGRNEREEKAELEVHAVLLKAWTPSLQRITGHYVWLQSNRVGKPHDVSDTENKLRSIRHTMEEVATCIEVESFPPRPNPLCGGEWGSCPVIDCEHRKGPRK